MATPLIDPKLLEIIQQEAKKAAQDVYNQKGTQYNIPSVPTHSHNNIDSPSLPATSINGFAPLPATVGGVVSPGTLGNQGVAQGAINVGYGYLATGVQASFLAYPLTVIYGHGAGADSAFNGGDAPEGTVLFFNNGDNQALNQLWVRAGGKWRGFTSNIGPY